MARFHRRALLAATPALVALSAVPATAHPDAEVLRACEAHRVAQAAFERDGGRLEPEVCPLAIAYLDSARAVSAAEVRTLDGVLAKARAAKREAQMPGGTEDPDNCIAGDWAWEVMNDLLRLAGDA